MKNYHLHNSIQEIIMNIGTSFELKKSARTSLSSYIEQLSCLGIAIIEHSLKDGLSTVVTKPRMLKKSINLKKALERYQEILKNKKNPFSKESYLSIQIHEEIYTLYNLPQFGYLLLIDNVPSLSSEVIKGLLIVNQKLAISLIACRNVDEIRKKDKIIYEQSKLAAMGQMIDSIAHQWLQPITILKLNLSLLKRKNEESIIGQEKIKSFVEKQTSYIDSLVETLQDFRSFFRSDANLESLSCSTLVKSTLSQLSDYISNKNIDIDINIDQQDIINVVVNEFKHVLLNLISNTVDAAEEKGIKKIKIKIYSEKNSEGISLFVEDNAGGIDENILHKMFDVNVTSKSSEKGSGVGLYLVSLIMKKMGATIFAENHNEGARFIIGFRTVVKL